MRQENLALHKLAVLCLAIDPGTCSPQSAQFEPLFLTTICEHTQEAMIKEIRVIYGMTNDDPNLLQPPDGA